MSNEYCISTSDIESIPDTDCTVQTVDDIMDQMEVNIPPDASLTDTEDYIRRIAGSNVDLARDAISHVRSLESTLGPVTINPKRLIKLMLKYNVLLIGAQATSHFYPICNLTDCPWDFFCHTKSADGFIDGYTCSSGSDLNEDIRSNDGYRVVYFTRYVNGMSEPCRVRVFVSDNDPLKSLFDMKYSYEQSIICGVGAMCFWARLQRSKLYREFKFNPGIDMYPHSELSFRSNLRIGHKTNLKSHNVDPSVYYGLSRRTRYQFYYIDTDDDDEQYYKDIVRSTIYRIQSIVYASSNHNTKYIGDVSDMK